MKKPNGIDKHELYVVNLDGDGGIEGNVTGPLTWDDAVLLAEYKTEQDEGADPWVIVQVLARVNYSPAMAVVVPNERK